MGAALRHPCLLLPFALLWLLLAATAIAAAAGGVVAAVEGLTDAVPVAATALRLPGLIGSSPAGTGSRISQQPEGN